MIWIGVALLGGIGSLARFLLDALVSEHLGSFPWGTLAVNLSGAFLLGLVVGLALWGDALLLGGTAALGSYTTVSTWMLETHRLGEEGGRTRMVLNALVNLGAGVGAAALGRLIGAVL